MVAFPLPVQLYIVLTQRKPLLAWTGCNLQLLEKFSWNMAGGAIGFHRARGEAVQMAGAFAPSSQGSLGRGHGGSGSRACPPGSPPGPAASAGRKFASAFPFQERRTGRSSPSSCPWPLGLLCISLYDRLLGPHMDECRRWPVMCCEPF